MNEWQQLREGVDDSEEFFNHVLKQIQRHKVIGCHPLIYQAMMHLQAGCAMASNLLDKCEHNPSDDDASSDDDEVID